MGLFTLDFQKCAQRRESEVSTLQSATLGILQYSFQKNVLLFTLYNCWLGWDKGDQH